MEAWVPLLDIFRNSPTPEVEASLWMQQSFNTSTTTTTTSPTSFLSLLSKPTDMAINDPSSPSTPTSPPRHSKRVMWIQTLPSAVQSRILSYLRVDYRRFCKRELCSLANNMLRGDQELEFWVKKAARNLLDVVSESNYGWVSGLSLDSTAVEIVEEEFEALPSWILSLSDTQSPIFPWLPVSGSMDEPRSNALNFASVEEKQDENSPVIVAGEGREHVLNEMEVEMENAAVHIENVHLDGETQRRVDCLKASILNFESTSMAVGIADEIRQLCMGKGGQGGRCIDPLAVFSLIEPWEANDETASVLLSHLSNVGGEDIIWQCQVLCSVVLPKMLILSEPASRVLVASTVEFCKLHQRAAVDALLFPLILRMEGINTPICDVVTRIIRECLHPAHVSSFCQKLLCVDKGPRRWICLSRHQCLLSDELVWTESLFTLFQNILNHNVHLTQDSVDCLATMVRQLCDRYSKSLKFTNFLLSLITKCEPSLKSHKLLLREATERTNTFMTKSILSKLDHL